MGGGSSQLSSADLTVDEKRRLASSLSGKYEAAIKEGNNDDKELFKALADTYHEGKIKHEEHD